jgi:hypothetical protein
LDNSEKYETARAHPSAARSEPWRRPCRPCPDCSRHLVHPRLRRPPFPPPSATASCGYKGSAPPTGSPFSTFVFCSRPASAPPRAMLMLTVAPLSTEHRLLRPPLCLTVASSSSTPRRCTSACLPGPAPHRRSSPLGARRRG